MSSNLAVETEKKIKNSKSELANRKINLNRIKSSKTKGFLEKFGLKKHSDIEKLTPHCYSEGISKGFHEHTKSYLLPHSLDAVWDAYINIPPAMAWSGKKMRFSFVYDSEESSICYIDDVYNGIKKGQSLFVEIRLLFGLVRLAVTHVVDIASKKDLKIKLCYGEGGKSEGSQVITFKKVSATETEVTHKTFYKSDSNFRDLRLYPSLHELIINDYHGNVKRYLDC